MRQLGRQMSIACVLFLLPLIVRRASLVLSTSIEKVFGEVLIRIGANRRWEPGRLLH